MTIQTTNNIKLPLAQLRVAPATTPNNATVKKTPVIGLDAWKGTTFKPAQLVGAGSKDPAADGSTPVKELQQFLKDKGLLKKRVDGDFRSDTLQALKAYQKLMGLPQTGTLDSATKSAITKDKQDTANKAGDVAYKALMVKLAAAKAVTDAGTGLDAAKADLDQKKLALTAARAGAAQANADVASKQAIVDTVDKAAVAAKASENQKQADLDQAKADAKAAHDAVAADAQNGGLLGDHTSIGESAHHTALKAAAVAADAKVNAAAKAVTSAKAETAKAQALTVGPHADLNVAKGNAATANDKVSQAVVGVHVATIKVTIAERTLVSAKSALVQATATWKAANDAANKAVATR